MADFDVIIIGAGVVGLAIAENIARAGKNILLIEKHVSFGQETSSRNSEVIHGGMYYPTNSLKAKLCVEGRKLLYALCENKGIRHKKIGKLIIAIEKDEIEDLKKIYKLGNDNGVEDLSMISEGELKKMEPNVNGLAALHSPETGIIDSHQLMQYFLDKAKDNGATIAFNCEVASINKTGAGFKVSINNGDSIDEIRASSVINCAGLDSDLIAQMAGIDIKKNKYELHYCKGQYFRVNNSKAKRITRLIYPVPKPKAGGLGIHATIDLAGGMRLGPDDEYLNNRLKNYSVDDSRCANFVFSEKNLMPFLEQADLVPDTSGIRPKLQKNGGTFRDFIIKEESDNGLPGLINLIGIESPGLTASPAIARLVGDIIKTL